MKILVELLGGTIGSHKDGNGTVVLGRDMTDILPAGIDAVKFLSEGKSGVVCFK